MHVKVVGSAAYVVCHMLKEPRAWGRQRGPGPTHTEARGFNVDHKRRNGRQGLTRGLTVKWYETIRVYSARFCLNICCLRICTNFAVCWCGGFCGLVGRSVGGARSQLRVDIKLLRPAAVVSFRSELTSF